MKGIKVEREKGTGKKVERKVRKEGVLLHHYTWDRPWGLEVSLVVFLLWSLIQTRLEDQRLIVLFGDEARRYTTAVPRYVPRRPIWLLPVLLTLLFLALAGCGGSRETGERQLELAPVSRLPKEVAAAPPVVREAYQFALANPDVLKFIPCYCGCGADHGSRAVQEYASLTRQIGNLSR